MPATPEEVLTRVEEGVLDRAHRRLNLLFRNEPYAIEALLRCFAAALRDLRTGRIPKPSVDAKSETANEGLRGLGHCLRWVRQCCPHAFVVPAPQGAQGWNEALGLLRWGAAYDPIWNQHSAYRGRLAELDVEESTKTITFRFNRNVDAHFFCSQVVAQEADDARRACERPDGRLAQLSKEWYESLSYSSRGLHFDDATISRSGAIDVAAEWMKGTCLPELSPTTMLVGCTVADVRRVLASLYVYSLFVTKLEDYADDQPGLDVRLPSRVVARATSEMTDWLTRLSGVERTSVEAIVSVLTFDPEHPHVTLAQQPFVGAREGRLFFLPRMLLLLDLPRMYVGAINRTKSGKTVYSHVIEDIEDKGVRILAQEMRSVLPPSFQIVEKRTFTPPAGTPITPDMVVLSGDHEILVIDVKHATPPFGPLDVRYDIVEAEKWKTRMSEYVIAFQQHSGVLLQHFKCTAKPARAVFGLILLRWPLPIPVEFEEPLCAVDWPSLSEYLRHKGASPLPELIGWARRRPDLPMPVSLEWKQRQVRVGEWTYRYSVLASTAPSE